MHIRSRCRCQLPVLSIAVGNQASRESEAHESELAGRIRDARIRAVSIRGTFEALLDATPSLANIGLGALSMFSTLMLIGAFAVLHAISARFGDIDRYLGRVGLVPACIVSVLMGFVAGMLWPLSEAPFIYFQF